MNSLCSDIGYHSLNKYGEELCGDMVEIIEQDDCTVIVLADGLGSGVKANILATLTTKILSTMMAQAMPIEECIMAVANTLPVCEVRQIAYSTFTVIRIIENKKAEIIQYDNPPVVMLRDGKHVEFDRTSRTIDNKTVYRSYVDLKENDVFILMSDGAIHAGVGKSLNFGWERKDIIRFMEKIYRSEYTGKIFTTLLLDQCNLLYENQPGDDTTVCSVRIRKRNPINVMIGPPANPEDDHHVMSLFFSKEGKHIVCGGTTATLTARYLKKEIVSDINAYIDRDIPPIAEIEGVDLVTEGVITINQVLNYAQDYLGNNRAYFKWGKSKDGASCLTRILLEEATDINFFVGKAVNSAHQNPDLPIGFSIKMRLVEELASCLKDMGKRIKVSYF